MTTRRVVLSAIIAALYATLTLVLAPISFGPLQFRAANLLMALMFFDIDFCFGLYLGVFIGNLASPFGFYDWLVMPLVTLSAALIANRLARFWYLGIAVWALITSAGVSLFPLGLGAGIPFWVTFPFILVSQVIVGVTGFLMWRPFRKILTSTRSA